jgi:protein-disulfide isomerase
VIDENAGREPDRAMDTSPTEQPNLGDGSPADTPATDSPQTSLSLEDATLEESTSPDPVESDPEADSVLPGAVDSTSNGKDTDAGRYIRIRRSHFYALLLPLAFVAGIAYGYLIWGRNEAVPAAPAEAGDTGLSRAIARIEVEADDDPALGPEDAPITIIEFSDFNCPYCQRWHQEVFEPLLASYPGQIRFIYRDFPIVGGGGPGMAAAQAANCAGEQDRYWEFHGAMFSGIYALNGEGFAEASGAVGLDSEALLECYESGRYETEVQADLQYGAGLGVSGTPTFFINGIPLVGAQPLLRFVEIINAELGG